MVQQLNLFNDLPPAAEKQMRFAPAQRPIWTENKARLIERYLYYFVLITKHGAYIDGFAGPQYRDNRDAWAARLVLASKPPFLRKFWLCELDPKSVGALNDLVAEQPKIRGRSVKVVPGDFNANVEFLLAESGIGDSVATFCLLDQRMFECHWDTLIKLAQHRREYKIELFYFLASGWVERSMGGLKDREILRKWWGRNDFEKLPRLNSFDRRQLFIKRMKEELGYKHVYAFPIYSKEHGGRVLYHMIHASDHDEAPRLMNRAYRNALSAREDLRRLQKDLREIWGDTGRGERPVRD